MNQDQAKGKVIRFGQMHGREVLDLASHAAFPLAITPDLLYCLRENFLPRISWLAVADLVMSPLCSVVGNELYEIDASVRDVLLRRLSGDCRFGETRLQELSKFMVAYIHVQTQNVARDIGQELQWVALAYANPHDTARLRAEIRRQIELNQGKVRERLAMFLDEQEDLLLAAGLEPLIVSTHQQLRWGLALDTLEVDVVKLVREEETDEAKKLKTF